LKDEDVAQYLQRVQKVMEEVLGRGSLPQLVAKTEFIVGDLESSIRQEGVDYSTPNESNATARALLWIGWVSWLWTAKAERKKDPDFEAKRIRPIVEKLMDQFTNTGRRIGRDGGTPESFLEEVGNQ
jgi:hypothetical protein